MDPNATQTIQVSCGLGLAPYVRQELQGLGYRIASEHATGLEIAGTLRDVMRLNLHLRTAQYVMILLKSFRCRSSQQLYERIADLAWERIVPSNGYISVVSRVETPSIDNTMYANVKVKDAIVDRLLERTGSRPDSGKARHGLVFYLYWKGDRARLYLNTCGQKLSDRGYRKMPHTAPLRESLAAAVLMATGYDGSVPLVNPMCGSGTLAIEAALLAAGRAPGLLRSTYAFTQLKDFDQGPWQTLRNEALKHSRKHVRLKQPAPIIASDVDPKAVQAAKKNAMTAGVEHMIDLQVGDFAETALPRQAGILVLNPEYGSRLGQAEELRTTYGRIGDFFKQHCCGWTGYIFTGNLDLAKCVGLRTSARLPFFNANIECRLLKYEMYEGSRKARSRTDTPDQA